MPASGKLLSKWETHLGGNGMIMGSMAFLQNACPLGTSQWGLIWDGPLLDILDTGRMTHSLDLNPRASRHLLGGIFQKQLETSLSS